MLYPDFLNKKDLIGVVALSNGCGKKMESFNNAKRYLEKYFNIIKTKSVLNKTDPSNSAITRANELNELIKNNSVKAIFCAKGGDFQFETHPFINYQLIKDNPKWYLGMSDPTNLLFPITCKLDIATIYGFNFTAFDDMTYPDYMQALLEFLQGEIKALYSSEYHEKLDYYNDGKAILNTKTKYLNDLKISGRMIGGCFECIVDMSGTPYDYMNDFNNRYDENIFYFDIFGMNSKEVYIKLLKLKSLDYFKNTKAVLVGRVLFNNESEDFTYVDAFEKALDIPCVFNVDIGHTYPSMFIINGAIYHIDIKNGKGVISYELK